ncbi:MAG: hypothetical protein KF886_03500 [Candidatus Hydrogenedentes bacterium]|nr:hypothetical protein [Candidatus Hydrogenedentota bacterium]
MNQPAHEAPKSVPLGGLGTGAVELCADGRFRNLTINNNRTLAARIPLARHSFLAIRASGDGRTWMRRLQTPCAGEDAPHLLPAGALKFRGQYPQADYQVEDPAAPVTAVWSAFAPVVPYDYEASALPLLVLAVQVTNRSPSPCEVSVLFNWENTCGASAIRQPDAIPPITPDTLVTQADWDQMKQGGAEDHERRLRVSSGRIDDAAPRDIRPGDVAPNALVYGGLDTIQANEDGQYCIATPWSRAYRTSLAIWDPEDAEAAGRFWRQFEADGEVSGLGAPAVARAGAVCNRFTLGPGESRRVTFVAAWYCPRYVVNGVDEGNYYTNNYSGARAVALAGLADSAYLHSAVSAWQQRLHGADLPPGLARRLLAACEVLSTNSLHARDGAFGLMAGPHDPRVNYLRDRWFWSFGLMLFFPRLETEMLERASGRLLQPETRALRISDGLEGFNAPEFAAGGAARVEACAQFVLLACRNFRYGGNLAASARLLTPIQEAMAALLATDKDLDGFPDILDEEPGLDGASARGLNVITAGLWLVALHAAARLARREKRAEAALYQKASERASRAFERYFWNREHGYFQLYPKPALGLISETALAPACHLGQLFPIWIADFLDLPDVFSPARIARILEAAASRGLDHGRIRMLFLPDAAGETPDTSAAGTGAPALAEIYTGVAAHALARKHAPDSALCAQLPHALMPGPPGERESMEPARALGALVLWYAVVPDGAALVLSEKQLQLNLERFARGERRALTLYTPNGFGKVTVEVGGADAAYTCRMAYEMDIPQELASISISLPADVASARCRLYAGDETIPADTRRDAGNRLIVTPRVKLSTSALQLRIGEGPEASGSEMGARKWTLPWFRS